MRAHASVTMFAVLAGIDLFFASTIARAAEPAPQGAAFVGAAKCTGCHQREAELWRGSHHDHAMEPATASTVRGSFANAKFVKDGLATTFFRRGDEFFVRTDGPDGKLHEYRVAYTFGFEPLQQYLLEMP